jgi:membrane protease YdiL (CAAX protease family)
MSRQHKIIFAVVWILTILVIIIEMTTHMAALWFVWPIKYLYGAVLISLFIDSGFFSERASHLEKLADFGNYTIGGLLLMIFLITGLMVILGLKSSVILIMAVITFFFALLILIKYRGKISKKLIINGLIMGTLSCVMAYKFIPSLIVVFFVIPFFFVAGSILNEKLEITTIHLNNCSLSQIVRSFLIGCFLGLPMAISNMSDIISTNELSWISQGWQLILPFNAVMAEETWVRLFLICLVYSIVSAKTDRKYIPVISAIIVSSFIFGFTHYPHIPIRNCIDIIILYGFPLGVLFCRRDFESAVGFHFIINFIGALAAFWMNPG